jgi:hypothetical protein
MSWRDDLNDELNEKRKDRVIVFLKWAEEHLRRISHLGFADDKSEPGYKSHLRVAKKTALLSLLDTLAVAFEDGGPGRNRQAFVSLVETRGDWPEATRVSAVHLARALNLHFETTPQDRSTWDKLDSFFKEKYAWLAVEDAREKPISVDPAENEVRDRWPSRNGEAEKLKCHRKPLDINDFRHSYLLYRYRNCLVHESREQTFSYENDGDSQPLYMAVGSQYHLVYPLPFLINLTKTCIESIRTNVTPDPYLSFRYGPYIIQALNARQA